MSDSLQPHGSQISIQSMEFSRPEYWSGWPFPSSGDLPNPGIEPRSPHCRRILYQLSHKGSPCNARSAHLTAGREERQFTYPTELPVHTPDSPSICQNKKMVEEFVNPT